MLSCDRLSVFICPRVPWVSPRGVPQRLKPHSRCAICGTAEAVKFHDIPYSLSLDILYRLRLVSGGAGFDHGRTLHHQIEFADEGVSVEDQDALVDRKS